MHNLQDQTFFVAIIGLFFFVEPLLSKDIEAVKNQAFTYLQRVSSYNCMLKVDRSDGAIWNVTYLRNGDLYRIDRENVAFATRRGKQVVPPYSSWAFDGQRYQAFDERTKSIKIADGRHAVGSPDPC